MDIKTHIDDSGRLLIPAVLRKKHNLNAGESVVIRVVNNEVKLVNMKQVISEAQALIRKYIPKNVSLVAELNKMRDEEYEAEINKLPKHSLSKKKEK